jgi:multidrug resistance protein, MATE family
MLTHKNGHREVFALAWPIMVTHLSYTAMSVADSIFVGRLGTTELAAVGVAWPTAGLPICGGIGVLAGVKILAAKATGKGDHKLADRLAWQGLWLAVALGFVASLTACTGPWLFSALGCTPEVAAEAATFFGIRVAIAPIVFIRFACAYWLNARGDTRTPMVTGVFSNILNVLLDPLLIFGWGPVPGLGVAGAAITTAFALTVEACLLVWRIYPFLRVSDWRPDLALLKDALRLGVPVGTQEVLEVASWVFFVSVLARVGDLDLAAHVIAVRINCVSFLPGYALGEAASVLVGQALGAGRPDGARRAWASATRMALGVMCACGVVFFLFPDPLIAVFGASPEVVEETRQVLYIAALFQVFDAIATVGLCTLSGAGDTRFVMVISVAAAWVLKIPAATYLAVGMGHGASGAWAGLTLEILFVAGAVLLRIRGGRWLGATQHDGAVALAAK